MGTRDEKINELVAKVDYLTAIITKARNYAQSDPEVALMQARKSAEAVCRQVFSAEIGEPGKIMLDVLINKLRAKNAVPPRILIPLGTIQAYGNYGAHAQSDDTAIDTDYVEACLSALATVTSWYFLEYLGIDLPPDITGSQAMEGAPTAPAPAVATPPPLEPQNLETALHEDGTKERYLPDPCFEGNLKKVYFTPEMKKVVKLYKSARGDRNRLQRLQAIVSKFNPTRERDRGGAAATPRSASYFRERFCWPETVIVKPTLGVVASPFPEEFTFRSGRLFGKEKKARWFLSEKLRAMLPEEDCGQLIDQLRICISLSRSVRRLHQAGLCHSDLSPNNVLVDFASGRALITDVEELVVPDLFPAEVLGTPGYMAPEQLSAIPQTTDKPKLVPPSISSDEHALAVIIYELLLQRHPLRGPKVRSAASAEEDERLSLGEQALFIENPVDQSNRPKDLSPPCTALGPQIARFFERAFVDGLHTASSRPSAYDWEAMLVNQFDGLYPCQNDSCFSGWFFLEVDSSSQRACPFCETPISTSFPTVVIRQASKEIVLPLWDGLGLYQWHLTDIFPNEEVIQTRLASFSFQNGEWVLSTEGQVNMTTQEIPQKPLGSRTCLSVEQDVVLHKEAIQARIVFRPNASTGTSTTVERRKAILRAMLEDPEYNGWRTLRVLQNAIGADEETTVELLLAIGARGSTNDKPLWCLIDRHPPSS